ncbi:transcriptional regulator sdnM [Penicillium sp. IBT 16267x]|nr:transcriptional regulator sdnM [Penicillium sp. IBT 16267x]
MDGFSPDVYPIHVLDNIKANHCYVDWLMRFNDVLDAEKLKAALSRLLEIGDWKKLGGRLRRKVIRPKHPGRYEGASNNIDIEQMNGNLEIHVSGPSATGQQNVYFTHDSFDLNIDEHPVASRLPKETPSPSIQTLSPDTRPLIARPDFPTFEEMVRKGLPSISLHITSFRDATLVALVWPHVLMDAIGAKALLKAWSSVLAGREEDVPTVLGAREDMLRPTKAMQDSETPEEFGLEKWRLKGISMIMFLLRFVWDKFWNPRRERRILLLPKSDFGKICDQARMDVAQGSRQDEKPFISDSDILTAWLTRAVASSEPGARPFTVLNLMNARYRIPYLLKSGASFIQNMVLGTYSFFSSQLPDKSVGSIALDLRRNFSEQATQGQTVCFLESVFRDLDAGRSPGLLFGDSKAVLVAFNNLLKADLIRTLDFSPAVVSQGEVTETRANPLGSMVFYYNEAIDDSFNEFNLFVVLGQDHRETYWVLGTLSPRGWKMIEEELGRI